jgi:hypothetical protein
LGSTTDTLQRAIARATAGRSKVQQTSRNSRVSGSSDSDTQSRQLSRAGEDISTLRVRVRSAGDLGVVSVDCSVGHQDQSGAGVGDAGEAAGGVDRRADFIGGGGEFPEAVGGGDGRVGDGAGVFGGVGVAEVVGAVSLEGEVGGEEGGVEGGFGVVEEGGLLAGGDCFLC